MTEQDTKYKVISRALAKDSAEPDIEENVYVKIMVLAKQEQNFLLAMSAAGVVALSIALFISFFCLSYDITESWLSPLLGLGVGNAVRYFGKGFDRRFGIVAAGFTFLGCVAASALICLSMETLARNISYVTYFMNLPLNWLKDFLIKEFSFLDILLYSITVFASYKISFRQLSETELLEYAKHGSI